jgi:hypothetical protein
MTAVTPEQENASAAMARGRRGETAFRERLILPAFQCSGCRSCTAAR